jgi:hypothetical protein
MGKLASSMIHDGKCMTDLKPLFFFFVSSVVVVVVAVVGEMRGR